MPRSLIYLWMTVGLVGSALGSDVTVLLDFDGPHSDRSVLQMKREVEQIVKESGVRLQWRTGREATGDLPANLVVVRFRGRCVLEPDPILYDERGPFASAYSTDGEMLPFTEVDCHHVAASVQTALAGDDFGRLDYLMGRALGRVVAHELVHVLTRSAAHGQDGVTQAALSGKALIGAPLRLSRADLERLRLFRTKSEEPTATGAKSSPGW